MCNMSRTIPKRFLPRNGRFRLIEAPHGGVMHAVITLATMLALACGKEEKPS